MRMFDCLDAQVFIHKDTELDTRGIRDEGASDWRHRVSRGPSGS